MRLLLLLSLVGLVGCDSLDPFGPIPGSYSATVRGEQRLDLRGGGNFGGAIDSPPTTSEILLTGTNGPSFRFRFPTGSLQPGTYAVPGEATAVFETDVLAEPPYTATAGTIEIASVATGRAEGSFSFTATRPSGTITATGAFVAE